MKRFFAFAFAAACAISFFSCKQKKEEKKRSEEKTVFTVRSAQAVKKEITTYIDLNGDIEAKDQVNVYPDMEGNLVRLNVMLGDKVGKDEIIGYVDPSKPGTNYALSAVKSPIAGSVVSVPFHQGSKVTTGSAIATIGDTSKLQVAVKIPERYIGLLKIGLKCDVMFEAYGEEKFVASLKRISPVVDSISRTKQVHFEFDKFDPRINSGMFAKIRLFTKTISDAIVVPSASVQLALDERSIYVIKSGEKPFVERRAVKVGDSVDGFVQILEGVQPGERVVTQGIQVLSDGALVNDITK